MLKTQCKPHDGVLKLNMDASAREGSGVVGLGGVVRDSCGVVDVTQAIRVDVPWSVEVAELMAIKESLKVVATLNISIRAVECDT